MNDFLTTRRKPPFNRAPGLLLLLALALAACDAAGGNNPPPAAGDDPPLGIMSESTAKAIFDYSHSGGGVRIDRFKGAPALAAYLGVDTDGGDAEAGPPDRTFTVRIIAGKPVTEIAARAFAATPGNDISTLISAIALPNTITALGADLFNGVKNPVNMEIPAAVAELLGQDALIAAAGDDGDAGLTVPSAPGPAPPVVIVQPRPGLLDSAVNYAPSTGALSVTFTFNMAVTAPPGEEVAVSGSSVTVTPQNPAPGTQASISLTAANPEDPTKTTTVTVECMPVGGVFDRASLSGAYSMLYYDKNRAAGLEDSEGTEHWLYVTEEEAGAGQLFNTIYTAAGDNAPVLGLFSVTFGEANDRVEVKGTELPPASAGIAVIDIGLPAEDNTGLPAFYIPYGALGAEGQDYAHIRIRVNRGACLIIEADNSGYTAGGQGNPCPPGNLTGGAVEVAGGGRLRSGAYEGFPLGQGTAITTRLGSWLAVGPESSFGPSSEGYDAERDRPYEGWLVGPSSSDARILWGAGDQNGSYIEVRAGRIAFDANVTLRKSLFLAYDVGFVGGPALTVDVQEDDPETGVGGLFARGPGYRFYGTKSSSGGQNPSKPAARVIIKRGSAISRSFLTGDDGASGYITATDGDITINNKGKGSGVDSLVFTVSGTTRNLYLNWNIP